MLDEQVTGGNVSLKVIYMGLPLATENFPMSKGMTLPAGPGAINWSMTVPIPSIAPKGSYVLQMSFIDQNNQLLTCFPVSITISAPAEEENDALTTVPLCTGTTATHFNVESAVVSGDSTKTINVKGTLDEQVTGGNVSLKVIYEGIPLATENFPMSKGMTLPAGPGAINWSMTVPIPSIAPKGNYVLQMSFIDQNNQLLTCFPVSITISAPAEEENDALTTVPLCTGTT